MARAIWRGAISFGMVSIPVKLYTATESKDVAFRQLVAEDLKPLKQLRWSPTLDREVQYEELVKGYEYAKDQYVIIDDEDFEQLPVPSKHTIAITGFVDAREIDPVYYEKAYQLDPDEVGVRPFALLLQAMEQKGLVGIGKLALRQKEHLVVLRPAEGRVMLETLFYPDEVRPFEGIDVSGVQLAEQELQMAFALVDMLHEPFDPTKYHDEYRDALMSMISTKLEGGEVVAGEEQAPAAQTVDLMAALRASIEATQARKAAATPPPAGAGDGQDEAPAAATKRAPRKKKAAAG
ncbi:MAG: Ku protein [Dehalococcoidia bacterium]